MLEQVRRLGLIVPSSNTTMETEIPQFMREIGGDRFEFTFHSARVRMKHVQRDELEAMNGRASQAMTDLMDAPLDAVAYACLVAIMAMGHGHHRRASADLHEVATLAGKTTPIVTSAGALVEQLQRAGAHRIALIMPYADELARSVVGYLEAEGFTVVDYVNLGVTDNAEVARIPGERVLNSLSRLTLKDVDQVILSACVQMPSRMILDQARVMTGIPTTSAAECTARSLMDILVAG